MSITRLRAIARKEIIQLRRDVRSLTLAFFLPLLLILLFGYAISLDVRGIRLGVLDQSRTAESRGLIDAFAQSGYFDVTARVDRAGSLDALLGRGSVQLGLVIPPSFRAELATRRGATLQILLDGSDANTATIAQNYADAIIARYAATLGGRRSLSVDARIRVWYNETLESRNMVVPGLIAVIMAIIAAMLTALTMAREWERGTMEQLAATPVQRLEVVLGKLLPYVGIGLIDVGIAILAGVLIFDVPLRGSLLLLGLMTLLFLFGALGWGMFLSAALKSQLLATQAAILTTYLPSLLLSGFIFSISAMPLVLRIVTYIVPARYFVSVTKGVFLKGVGLGVLWIDGVAMIVFAAVGVTAAIGMFRKELA